MAIAFLELLPAFGENRTGIVEAEEQDIRSPSQAIADVERRCLATGKPLLAIGAEMFFAGKSDASFDVHVISSAGAWPLVSVGCFYRFTGAPTWGTFALPAREAGDVSFKDKDEKIHAKEQLEHSERNPVFH